MAHQFSFDELLKRLTEDCENGLVKTKREGDLALYNYTEETHFKNTWTPTALLARGLVLDLVAKKVVATPFPKFFNYGERGTTVPGGKLEATVKLDGSLGIIYHHNGSWRVNTRGSFKSPQVKWALAWLEKHGTDKLVPGWTYCVEIIYTENRIVISYPEDQQGLHLLAVFNQTGIEFKYDELVKIAQTLQWKLVERMVFDNVEQLLTATKELDGNHEGWVVLCEDGSRVKFKGDEYTRIHRLIKGVTPMRVWEHLSQGDTALDDTVLPEELTRDYREMRRLLTERYERIMREVEVEKQKTATFTDKELGTVRIDQSIKGILFCLRKGKDITSTVWGLIRPKGNNLPGFVPSTTANRFEE